MRGRVDYRAPSAMGPIIVLAVTFGLIWLLFILPQQKRLKAHRGLVARLEVGDEVMTTSGLFGTVVALDGEVVSLEVAPGVVVRSVRGAVARRLSEEASEGADEPSRASGTAADRAVATEPNPTES